jgi:hypothetical protein
MFSSAFETSDSDVTIISCQFIECHSNHPGAAIHIEVPTCELSITSCLFNVCRCLGRGGAISTSMSHLILARNCFQFCRCGKEDGNDGSTIYAYSKTGINTSLLSALKCPDHGDQCWYGIIILCNGVLDSRNINISNSDVEYIVGLAHFRPEKDKSFLYYYTSTNHIHGNALAFIDFSFPGNHQFGSLVNDSTKSGIFYVQNTNTTLKNYYFLENKGPLTYACVGVSKGSFVDCYFSCADKKKNYGIGFGETVNCLWGQASATTLKMAFLDTAYCIALQGESNQGTTLSQKTIFPGMFIGVFCTLVVSVGLMYRKLHWRINVMKRRK